MKPVFREEMEYLGIDKKYEGYLWVDKRAYRGFNKNFELVKYGRNIEKLPQKTEDLLTHEEYCDWHYKEYTSVKVEDSKRNFKSYLENNNYEEYIVSVSGEKDSTVMGDLSMGVLDELVLEYRVLFGNTSNETHYTYKYVKDTYGDKLEIANPKEGFYTWCKRTSYIPTRFGRACL